MTPRRLHSQPLYLEPEKAALLAELSAESRISKAVLLREAVDDLLAKHGKAAPASNVVALETKGKLAARRIFDAIAREHGRKNFAEMEKDVAFHKALPKAKRRASRRRP